MFAKAPVPGRVKTRLFPCLSERDAAKLHQAFVEDVWARHQPKDTRRARELCFHGESTLWEELSFARGERRSPQRGEGLGERMHSAACAAFEQSELERIVFIGSDSPTLPRSHVDEAFSRLKSSPVVFGPAIDGGYYLLGLQREALSYGDLLFHGLPWGSDAVLRESVDRLIKRGVAPSLLPYWYDVDRPSDLAWLRLEISLLTVEEQPPATARFLEDLEHRA